MSELLRMERISKRFPGVQALDGIEFAARSGEAQALMGENGAGKSTLLKILTGVYAPDSGGIFLDGERIVPKSPLEAQKLGISAVYQEVNLIPHLSVAENIMLGRQPMRWGRIDWKALNRRAEAALERLVLRIDVRRSLSSCSIAIQQMIAIARALDVSARLLILDEPTSSLDADETDRLFDRLRRLKAEGLGIVFVTHFLDQAYRIADRITVLRNGKLVGEYEAASLSRIELVARMVGKEPGEIESMKVAKSAVPKRESGPSLIEARGLGKRGSIEPFDLSVASGETVGLAGLLGSGRTEAARLLFGLDKADRGEILWEGKPITLSSAKKAIARGIGFLPEDRKTEAIIPHLSIRENIALALQSKRGIFRRLSSEAQRRLAEGYIRSLNIATPDAEKPIGELSGGNQQKAILARWLASEPRFLILDEPTRGVDVGAKAEIERLIRKLRDEGMALLFISSELEEMTRNADRAIILRDRKKVSELTGEEISESAIMRAIAGGENA